MASYVKVEWHHQHPDEPVWLYSEVVNSREVRKVEIYRDGRMDHADEGHAKGSTILSESLMPDIDEIAADPQFSPQTITLEEFEWAWQASLKTDPEMGPRP